MPPTHTQYRIGSGGFLYLLVSGIILTAAVYTQANLLFWGFGLMVGGVVLTLLIASIALRGIQITRLVPTHVAAGESLALRYLVENRGVLPAFGIVLRENWGAGSRGWRKTGPASKHSGVLGGPPCGWLLHLGPRKSTQTSSPCRPQQRGPLRFERIEASSSFPFGIIHKTVVFHQTDEVLVFPHLYRVRRKMINNLSGGNSSGQHTIQRAGGTEEFFGLREYRTGDSLRVIDWKRTARTGKLVAREMTQPSPPRIAITLDLRESPPMGAGGKRNEVPEDSALPFVSARQLEERAISLTASMICDAYMQGFRVGLRILGPGGASFKPRHSLPHRTRLLEALAKIDLNQRDGAPVPATDFGRTDVIIWSGRGTAIPKRPGGSPATSIGRGGKGTVLGAADFDQYVTDPAALAELNLVERRTASTSRLNAATPVTTERQNQEVGV